MRRFDFKQYETTRSFGESIYSGKIRIDEAENDQTNLLENIVNFDSKYRPRSKEDKVKKTFSKCKCSLWRSIINS